MDLISRKDISTHFPTAATDGVRAVLFTLFGHQDLLALPGQDRIIFAREVLRKISFAIRIGYLGSRISVPGGNGNVAMVMVCVFDESNVRTSSQDRLNFSRVNGDGLCYVSNISSCFQSILVLNFMSRSSGKRKRN